MGLKGFEFVTIAKQIEYNQFQNVQVNKIHDASRGLSLTICQSCLFLSQYLIVTLATKRCFWCIFSTIFNWWWKYITTLLHYNTRDINHTTQFNCIQRIVQIKIDQYHLYLQFKNFTAELPRMKVSGLMQGLSLAARTFLTS